MAMDSLSQPMQKMMNGRARYKIVTRWMFFIRKGLTAVLGLLSTVYFINDIIIFMDCNGIILIEESSKFGKFA